MFDIRSKFSNKVNIKIDFEISDSGITNDLYEIATKFPGKCALILHLVNNKGTVNKIQSDHIFISNELECVKMLQSKIGVKNVWIS